jgi:YebC/PmpR family DNA-binding regulatory protein
MEELLYEAFGPGGVAILIKVVTDNKNRTLPELKKILTTYGGSMGGSGSVQWMFEQWGIIVVATSVINNRDEFELELIDSGAADIEDIEDTVVIKTKIEHFQKVLQKIKELPVEPLRSGIEWVAKDVVEVSEEVKEQLEKLFESLEEHDDVEEYYTNAG